MSQTLTYIDQNGSPQGLINIAEMNHSALMHQLLEVVTNNYNDAQNTYDTNMRRQERYEEDRYEEYDMDYSKYLHEITEEAKIHRNYAWDLLCSLHGYLSETSPDVDMSATDWLEAFSTLISTHTDPRVLNYCRTITEEVARLLATEGNPRCYWA